MEPQIIRALKICRHTAGVVLQIIPGTVSCGLHHPFWYFVFEDGVSHSVAELGHHPQHLRLPGVQRDGANLGYVNAEASVYPGALNTQQHPQVDARPGGIYTKKVRSLWSHLRNTPQ